MPIADGHACKMQSPARRRHPVKYPFASHLLIKLLDGFHIVFQSAMEIFNGLCFTNGFCVLVVSDPKKKEEERASSVSTDAKQIGFQ